MSFGPSLPPHLLARKQHDEEHEGGDGDKPQQQDQDDEYAGPQLPPHLAAQRKQQQEPPKRATLGPQLPPGFGGPGSAAAASDDDNSDNDSSSNSRKHARDDEEEEDDDVIGPMLALAERPGQVKDSRAVAEAMEERAKRMAAKLRGEDVEGSSKVERGEWMLKLPEKGGPSFDMLKPRTFSAKGYNPDEDRSGWTDSPEEKARKRAEARDPNKRPKTAAEEEELARARSKDRAVASQIKEYNESKRSKSLLDEYKTQILPGRLGELEDVAARGFDREKDVVTRKMDPKKAQEVIQNSASGVASRFHNATRGSTYL